MLKKIGRRLKAVLSPRKPPPERGAEIVQITLVGKVQGVGLRRAVKAFADTNNLAGWVANARKGDVVLLVHGDPRHVARLGTMLRKQFEVTHFTLRHLRRGGAVSSGFEIIDYKAYVDRLAQLEYKSSRHIQSHVAALDRENNRQNSILAEIYRRHRQAAPGAEADAIKCITTSTLLRRNEAGDSVVRKNKDLSGVSSFRKMIYLESRADQLVRDGIYRITSDKLACYRFARAIGVDHPSHTEPFALSDARQMIEKMMAIHPEGIAVKPVSSFAAAGVYLVRPSGGIAAIGRSQPVADIDELLSLMADDLRPIDATKSRIWHDGKISRDNWYIEECISADVARPHPANDLKFYCFYGEASIVLEAARYPAKVYSWWDATNGAPILNPKGADQGFAGKGRGITAEQADVARFVSLHIPTPFMRIDFLDSRKRFVFNELGGRPGLYSRFNPAIDQMLGDRYLAAAARLKNDLLAGKRFDDYLGIMEKAPSQADPR